MKRIKEFLSAVVARYATRKRKKYKAELQRRSYEELQVSEFNGRLFLSYKNVPLIDTEYLNDSIANVLGDMRTIWILYHLNRINDCEYIH